MSDTQPSPDPIPILEQFVSDQGIDLDHVTVTEETNPDGDPTRYLLAIEPTAARDQIVAFFRMRAENLVYTDGHLTWVYADYVHELPTGDTDDDSQADES